METGATAPRLLAANKDSRFYFIKNGDNSAARIIDADDDGMAVCNSKDNNFVAAGVKDGSLYIFNATGRADILFARFF